METLKAGNAVLNFIKLCYKANRPVLLSGRHGIGKSELLELATKELGIAYLCRDLSLMEPPDLLGLPIAKGGKTVYQPPAFLPQEGNGILVFEELNRCERYMRAPCLQLLTARTLNDYHLPSGWLPVAAINPGDSEEGYDVGDLDPALLSRFVQVSLEPNRSEWLAWARTAGIHEAVIDYVEQDGTVFDHPTSNPRAWKYVSDVVSRSDENPSSVSLRAAVMGLVGDQRAMAFLKTLKNTVRPLEAPEILKNYPTHRAKLRAWIQGGKLDMVRGTLVNVQRHLQPETDYNALCNCEKHLKNVTAFLKDLPGDLQEQVANDFKERGYTGLLIETAKGGSR